MEEALKDERFSHILTDRRFRKMPRNIRKVNVDKRFKGMFKEKKFKGNCMSDKRGRPLSLTEAENLKKLYEISSESENDEDATQNRAGKKGSPRKSQSKKSSSDHLEEESSEEPQKQEDSSLDDDSDEELSENYSNPVKVNSKVKQLETLSNKIKSSAVQNIHKKRSKQLSKRQKNSVADNDDTDEELSRENKESFIKKNFKLKQLKTMSIKKKDSTPKSKQIIRSKISLNVEKGSSSENNDSDENENVPVMENVKSKQLKTVSAKKKDSTLKGKKIIRSKKSLNAGKVSSSEDNDSDEKSSEIDENEKVPVIENLKSKQQKSVSAKKKDSILKGKQIIRSKKSLKVEKEDISSSEDNESDEKLSEIDENEKVPVIENLKSKQLKTVSAKKKNSTLKNKKGNGSVQIEGSGDEYSSSDDAADKDSSEESDESDDSESDDSSGDISEDFDHHWEELRNEAPDTDEISRRIAVCNMDWDRIRAEDLFACFHSFKVEDGHINSVKIYPSDYGLKRMEEEKTNGPSELVEETLPLDGEEEQDDTKGSRYHREKLRQYQINRLKYYYAVVDCDSSETANALYEQLNGMEYESSSVRFDLRFIPDDVTFEHEPASIADKPPNPSEYKPRLFVTAALQQVKVNLTWDETDPKRRETLERAFTEPDNIEKDIQDYLASSSGESEEEELHSEEDAGVKLNTKSRIAKYKELLLSLEEKEKVEENKYEMEITWEPGLKEKTEEIVKGKMKKDNLNPFEEMLQKKQEDRKMKRKEQKSLQKQEEEDDDSADSNDEFFSKSTSITNEKVQNAKKMAELALISGSKKEMNYEEKLGKKSRKSKLQKRKQKPQNDNFKMDVEDPRFSAIYSSHLYNIDPSDPHFKDTEGNRALIQEKQRKLKSTDFYERNKNSKKARYT